MAQLDEQERVLQRSLEQIRFAIERTLATLRFVDEQNVAEHGPLFPLMTGDVPLLVLTQHNELSNPSPVGVREALFDHLQTLLKQQQVQAELFRQRHAQVVLQALTRDAERGRTAFRDRARRQLMADAQRSGEVPAATLKKLGIESEVVLGQCVAALEANPSQKNFTLTLKSLGDSMLLKSSVEAGMQATALASLKVAAAKRLKWALAAFRAKATAASAQILAGWIQRAMQLGVESSVTRPAVEALQAAAAKKPPGPS